MAAANLGWCYLSPKRERLHQGVHCAKDWHGHPCQSAGGAPKGAARGHISRRVKSNRCSGPEVTRRACAVRLGRHMSPCRSSWQAVKHSPVPRVRTRPASVRHTTHMAIRPASTAPFSRTAATCSWFSVTGQRWIQAHTRHYWQTHELFVQRNAGMWQKGVNPHWWGHG